MNQAEILKALAGTERKAVKMRATGKTAEFTQSKFGGSFYLPQGEEIPTHPEYGEMECLAQINLAEITPPEGFPTQGILQFFVATHPEAVEEIMDCETAQAGELFAVKYYPTVEQNAVEAVSEQPEERWEFSLGEGKAEFEPVEEYATLFLGMDEDENETIETDFGFDDAQQAITSELVEKAGVDFEECSDADAFFNLFGNWGSKLGGHPSLRQADPRKFAEDEETEEYTVLLCQLDCTTEEETEADTLCFFIKPDDLKARNFDNVILYWHNCF